MTKLKVCHVYDFQVATRFYCLEDLFCLSKCISSEDSPTLAAAFEEKARSTHKLVAAFVQLNGTNSLRDEIYRRYQRSQTEVCHSSLPNLTRDKLFDDPKVHGVAFRA
jgi:hypothetical protein